MKTITDETIDTLNSLIELCRDSAACFETASDDLSYPELLPVLRTLTYQRRDFIEELSTCVMELGGVPEGHGTLAGAVRQGWMQLREAVAIQNAQAILVECERNEERVIAGYDAALAKLLDPDCVAVVRHQSHEVHGGYDSIRSLRESVVYRERSA